MKKQRKGDRRTRHIAKIYLREKEEEEKRGGGRRGEKEMKEEKKKKGRQNNYLPNHGMIVFVQKQCSNLP